MDFLSFFIGLWVGGIVGVVVMALIRGGDDPRMPEGPSIRQSGRSARALGSAKTPK